MVKRIPGVRYVVAPYEADAQLGFLARNGQVDAVITEDSDIMLFGCNRVVFKLDRDGTGQEVDLSEVFSQRWANPLRRREGGGEKTKGWRICLRWRRAWGWLGVNCGRVSR